MRRHYEPSMAPEFVPTSQKAVQPILARPTGAVRVVDPGFIAEPPLEMGWTRVASADIATVRAEFAALPPEEPTPREQAQRARRARTGPEERYVAEVKAEKQGRARMGKRRTAA